MRLELRRARIHTIKRRYDVVPNPLLTHRRLVHANQPRHIRITKAVVLQLAEVGCV